MKVAVVGATGLVGRKMLQVLEERDFPVSELIPVASERSIGKEVTFRGKTHKVTGMQQAIAMRPDIAIFSAGGDTSLEFSEPRSQRVRRIRGIILHHVRRQQHVPYAELLQKTHRLFRLLERLDAVVHTRK